jgi:hypothetical protein
MPKATKPRGSKERAGPLMAADSNASKRSAKMQAAQTKNHSNNAELSAASGEQKGKVISLRQHAQF